MHCTYGAQQLETLTVVIAIQSGDPNRIGSASSAAIGSIAASTIAGIAAAALGAGAVVTIGAVDAAGWAGTQLGKKIWAEWIEDDPMNKARDKFHKSQRQSSPIILDLDGDGVASVTLIKRSGINGLPPSIPSIAFHSIEATPANNVWFAANDEEWKVAI